ncbi:MAG: serine protease [Patescibacteria group bacterium]|nr:serine protease [Patescibacteria group bacterium]
MKKTFLVLLIAFLFFGCFATQQRNELSVLPINVSGSDSDYNILSEGGINGEFLGIIVEGNKTLSGSGVVINRHGLILTCYSLVGGKKSGNSIKVFTVKGILAGKVIVADSQNDLAVVKVNYEFNTEAFLGDTDNIAIKRGAEIYFLGYPGGIDKAVGLIYRRGQIGGVHYKNSFFSKQERFIVPLDSGWGVAGSGIYKLMDGRMLGLVQGGNEMGLVVIPVRQIREFLDRHNIIYDSRQTRVVKMERTKSR